jgi:serine phosphatase RsbU (regulator of sigma subunit)
VSILRLRPWFPFWMGIGAAVSHAGLATLTLDDMHAPSDQAPAAFAYAVLLVFNGAAAGLVTRAARRYVIEAVAEATERERAAQRLANIERDLSVAREIQLGLLPKDSPALPGFDIAGMNKPADQTGGDYYDWQELPDGRLIVVMADVTGHGIGPALVMAVCRAYARASATIVTEPIALLSKLNNLLHADLGGARFITLAMALLNKDGNVELLSAGHGPTLLYRAADRGVQQYGGDGIPLGILTDEAYGPVRTLKLQRDDVLVMLTDGFFEYPNSQRQQFGLERLVEALKAAAPQPATKIIDHLYRSVLDYADGAPQLDDLTIVAIKRTM